MKNDGLDFVKYCNEHVTNKNEEVMAHVLISHLHEIDQFSLEDIAQEACISTASVSRFIKNAGFTSFRDFKNAMVRYESNLYLRRLLSFTTQYGQMDLPELSQTLYQKARDNLQATFALLDEEAFVQTIRQLKGSRRVIILGDRHELTDFFTVQLDLLVHGVVCELVNIHDAANTALLHLGPEDCVLYLDLSVLWFTPEREQVLQQIRHQHCPLIVICQESEHLNSYADRIHLFGIPGSMNDGYHSLPLLSRIMSEFLYFLR